MSDDISAIDDLIYDLKERAKELACLYRVQDVLSKPEATLTDVFEGIIEAIPPGWQYVDICKTKISYRGKDYFSEGFVETPWVQCADVIVQDVAEGKICVYYLEERPDADEGPFLKEERKLIDTISDQIGNYLLNVKLRDVFEGRQKSELDRKEEWWVILNLLWKTDPKLAVKLTKKMIQFLIWNGLNEAAELLVFFSPTYQDEHSILEANIPVEIKPGLDSEVLSQTVFKLASESFSEEEILANIHAWIREEQTDFLVNIMSNPNYSVDHIVNAMERYRHLIGQGVSISGPRERSICNALVRRMLSDQLEFVSVAKNYFNVDDFWKIIDYLIYVKDSQGSLGGKSSGLLLASEIINKTPQLRELMTSVKVPRSWFVTSDTLFHFIEYNELEDILIQKYKPLDQVRQEYPYVVQLFKSSPLPPEVVKGLSRVIDYFGDIPLIVRSSSLLEDRMGMAFAGKYKSLFIANQGTKEERLSAICEAVTEVFASMFGPDPIEYREEHGLINEHEEMAILIQEVIGTRVGPYLLPSYSGVIFGINEIPWSKRIKRDDGLIRMVPGLGTRAVDRLSDDYPVLLAPGKPQLRVNTQIDEILLYSPKKVDAINVESGAFESLDFLELVREFSEEYPLVSQIVSEVSDGALHQPRPLSLDFSNTDYAVTFNGVIENTDFLHIVNQITKEFQEKLGYPVDIEFAHDGTDFYLLQCRSQSNRQELSPAEIPKHFPSENLIFSANRHFPNGTLIGISHIVYVDPDAYSKLSDQDAMLGVGKAVGKLNQILPRRKFILMGPGRWGSRGDQGLGVKVTFADIRNACMLIEIARKQGEYIPEPSFGTHFFLDLVETQIFYLPLFPDEENEILNDAFLKGAKNVLSDLLPEYSDLENVIYVVDIPRTANGANLNIYMNVEEELAIAILEKKAGSKGERRFE